MTDTGCRIRAASLDDLAGLVNLEQACFAVPWSEESLRFDLSGHPEARYLVASAPDNSLAGYAAYWAALDEAQITNIAVAPDWRRRGVGRMLLEALISLAVDDGLQRLFLEVRQSNLAAIALYQSAGFQAIGIRRGYYQDNDEDAIIMLKNIAQSKV